MKPQANQILSRLNSSLDVYFSNYLENFGTYSGNVLKRLSDTKLPVRTLVLITEHWWGNFQLLKDEAQSFVDGRIRHNFDRHRVERTANIKDIHWQKGSAGDLRTGESLDCLRHILLNEPGKLKARQYDEVEARVSEIDDILKVFRDKLAEQCYWLKVPAYSAEWQLLKFSRSGIKKEIEPRCKGPLKTCTCHEDMSKALKFDLPSFDEEDCDDFKEPNLLKKRKHTNSQSSVHAIKRQMGIEPEKWEQADAILRREIDVGDKLTNPTLSRQGSALPTGTKTAGLGAQGKELEEKEDWEGALECHRQDLLELADRRESGTGSEAKQANLSMMHRNIGRCLSRLGKYKDAFEELNLSLNLASEMNEEKERSLLEMGNAWLDKFDDLKQGSHKSSQTQDALEEAKVCFTQSLTLCMQMGNRAAQARASLNLGMVESRAKNHETAIKHLQDAEIIFSQLAAEKGDDEETEYLLARCLEELAQPLIEVGQTPEAVAKLQECLKSYSAVHMRDVTEEKVEILQKLYFNVEEDSESFAYLKEAEALCKEAGLVQREQEIQQVLKDYGQYSDKEQLPQHATLNNSRIDFTDYPLQTHGHRKSFGRSDVLSNQVHAKPKGFMTFKAQRNIQNERQSSNSGVRRRQINNKKGAGEQNNKPLSWATAVTTVPGREIFQATKNLEQKCVIGDDSTKTEIKCYAPTVCSGKFLERSGSIPVLTSTLRGILALAHAYVSQCEGKGISANFLVLQSIFILSKRRNSDENQHLLDLSSGCALRTEDLPCLLIAAEVSSSPCELNLSHNRLTDKDMSALQSVSFFKTLTILSLSDCDLTCSELMAFSCLSPDVILSLQHLDLSRNPLTKTSPRTDNSCAGINQFKWLHILLCQSKQLQSLNLTDCTVQPGSTEDVSNFVTTLKESLEDKVAHRCTPSSMTLCGVSLPAKWFHSFFESVVEFPPNFLDLSDCNLSHTDDGVELHHVQAIIRLLSEMMDSNKAQGQGVQSLVMKGNSLFGETVFPEEHAFLSPLCEGISSEFCTLTSLDLRFSNLRKRDIEMIQQAIRQRNLGQLKKLQLFCTSYSDV